MSRPREIEMRANVRQPEAKNMLSAVGCLTLLVTTLVGEEGLVNHWKFDGNYKDSVGKNHAWRRANRSLVISLLF